MALDLEQRVLILEAQTSALTGVSIMLFKKVPESAWSGNEKKDTHKLLRACLSLAAQRDPSLLDKIKGASDGKKL